jgi:hypothetical protein
VGRTYVEGKDTAMIAKHDRKVIDIGVLALAHHCSRIAEEHGWWENEDRNAGELMMLVVTEVAEAFEEIRNGRALDEVYYVKEDLEYTWSGTKFSWEDEMNIGERFPGIKPEGPLVELADVLIRILDLVGHKNLSEQFANVVLWKMIFNESRPYRHGGKTA